MNQETEYRDVQGIEKAASDLARAIAAGLAGAAQDATQIEASASCLRLERSGLREVLLLQPAVAVELQFHKGLQGGAIFLIERSELLRLARLIGGLEEAENFDPAVTEACLQYFTDALDKARTGFSGAAPGGFAAGSPRLVNPDGGEERLNPFMEAYQDGLCATLQLSVDSNPEFLMRAVFDRAATMSLAQAGAQGARSRAAKAQSAGHGRAAGGRGSDNAYPKWNMDLILDVELGVIVAFGEAEMPLKDVLKLGIGSVIELDKGVNEPVTVIVNDKPIAKGEVVMVDGNYGVKVLEVESTAERIRSLG